MISGGFCAPPRTTTSRSNGRLDSVKLADDDEAAGVSVIRHAVEAPLRQICANAGYEGAVVIDKVREGKDDFGFNAATCEYENLLSAGVIDPKKVTRIVL